MPAMTPRAYVAKIKQYPPGDPRRAVAERRAAYAITAARAARAGDKNTARRAVSGLLGLAGLGVIDTAAIAERIRFHGAGGISTAEAQRMARTISTVAGLASGVVNIIASLPGMDPGLSQALRWVDAILMGRTPPGIDDRGVQDFCGVWRTWGATFSTFTENGILLVGQLANGGRPVDAEARNNIVSIVRWIKAALDGLCADVPVPSPAPTAPVRCATNGARPDSIGLPQDPLSCCAGLHLAEDGRCMPPPREPLSAYAQAFSRWNRAFEARRLVEYALRNPAVTEAARRTAQANESATAAALCAAENALLAFVPVIPQRGTPPTAEQTEAAGRALAGEGNPLSRALYIGALYSYSPPSSVPRCFIRDRGGCSCTNLHPPGTGGGGAGAAIALPAIALLWYMMK